MKILLDTNILLDWFLKREPFFDQSSKALKKSWFQNYDTYITIHSLCDLWYIMNNHFPLEEKKSLISFLLSRSKILSEDRSDIQSFLTEAKLNDMEDALQLFTAERNGIKYVLTRDKEFKTTGRSLKIITPEEFNLQNF